MTLYKQNCTIRNSQRFKPVPPKKSENLKTVDATHISKKKPFLVGAGGWGCWRVCVVNEWQLQFVVRKWYSRKLILANKNNKSFASRHIYLIIMITCERHPFKMLANRPNLEIWASRHEKKIWKSPPPLTCRRPGWQIFVWNQYPASPSLKAEF